MKTVLSIFSISLLLTLFTSCSGNFSIAKRHYRDGYYFSYSNGKTEMSQPGNGEGEAKKENSAPIAFSPEKNIPDTSAGNKTFDVTAKTAKANLPDREKTAQPLAVSPSPVIRKAITPQVRRFHVASPPDDSSDRQTHNKAVMTLSFGLASLLLPFIALLFPGTLIAFLAGFSIVLAILAIIFGREIMQASGVAAKDYAMARTGKIMGIVYLALTAVALILLLVAILLLLTM